jgi:hypothetical protein
MLVGHKHGAAKLLHSWLPEIPGEHTSKASTALGLCCACDLAVFAWFTCQVLCRSELTHRPAPQLVLSCCCVLVAGGGCTTERIFKHNPPQELVERLAAAVASTAWSLCSVRVS